MNFEHELSRVAEKFPYDYSYGRCIFFFSTRNWKNSKFFFRSIRISVRFANKKVGRKKRKKRKISVRADDLWRAIPKAGAARSSLASFAEKGNGVKIRGQKSAYDTEERLVSG